MSGSRARSDAPPQPGAALGLGALVVIAVLAPWPYGAVQPGALAVLLVAALVSCAAALALAATRGGLALPALPLWPLAGFVTLSLAQLVPLPEAVHGWLAPGSAALWHPREPLVAAVLGAGPRPISLDPATTLRGVALVAGLGLLAMVSAPALARARTARPALTAVALCGFVLTGYAIWARARFGPLLYGRVSVPTIAPFGPFVNKNHFAGWTALGALLTAGLACGLAAQARRHAVDSTAGRRAAGVVLALVAALAMALGVLASLSRGGAFALAAGAGCLAWLRLSRSRASSPRAGRARGCVAGAITVLLGATLVALAPPAARERLVSLTGAEFRLATARDALRLAGASPLLGHGLGAFHDAFPRVKQANGAQRVEHAESEYLELLAETGSAGLLLVLCGLGALLRAAGRGERGAWPAEVACGAAAALVALAVHGVFDFDLRIPANAALAALAAGAAAAAAGVRPARLAPARTACVAAGALTLLAATLALPARRPASAREDVREAWASSSREVSALRLARAEAALVAALRLRPADAESWLLLAGVRAARGERGEAAALARHAVSLDPQRANLVAAASRIADGADSP